MRKQRAFHRTIQQTLHLNLISCAHDKTISAFHLNVPRCGWALAGAVRERRELFACADRAAAGRMHDCGENLSNLQTCKFLFGVLTQTGSGSGSGAGWIVYRVRLLCPLGGTGAAAHSSTGLRSLPTGLGHAAAAVQVAEAYPGL
jgi:hypothetical protein